MARTLPLALSLALTLSLTLTLTLTLSLTLTLVLPICTRRSASLVSQPGWSFSTLCDWPYSSRFLTISALGRSSWMSFGSRKAMQRYVATKSWLG